MMSTNVHQSLLADMDQAEREAMLGTANQPAESTAAEDEPSEAAAVESDSTPAVAEPATTEAAAESEATAPTAEEAAAALDEMATDKAADRADPAPQPKAFEVQQADFDAQRKALQAERKDAIQKWGNGEMSDEEYAAKLDDLDGKIFEVIQAQTTARTLADINAQNQREAAERQAQADNAAMVKVAGASKAASQIDYGTDVDACGLFDAAFGRIKLDPSLASLTLDQKAERAHRAVLAMRGIEVAAPAPAPTPAATTPAKPRPTIPPTLGGLPSAAANGVGDTFDEAFDAIEDPDEREARWAALPAAQRQQMLRRTVPTTRGRH